MGGKLYANSCENRPNKNTSNHFFIPQQPERLGVLPIKLRGGLGQRPEIWSPGSERFRRNGTGSERFRSEGSIHETLGSERF